MKCIQRIFTIFNKQDEVIKELFESLLNRYQIGLEISMRSSDFIFDWINHCMWECVAFVTVRQSLFVAGNNLQENRKVITKDNWLQAF